MTGEFAALQPSAAVALTDAIESLEPSAVVFETRGMAYQLAQYLVQIIKSGQPDMDELRSHGISQELAIEICTAIAKRHARVAAAMAKLKALPVPQSAPKPALPSPEELDGMSAVSRLHTLFEQAEGDAPACLSTLCRDGWSESTARELYLTIRAARAVFPRVSRS